MTGTSIAQLIPILLIPVLSRIYTPEEFGVYAVFLSLYVVLTSFATGRYEYAILLPKREDHAKDVFRLSVSVACMVSLIVLVLMVFLNEWIAGIFNVPEISVWLYLLPACVLLFGLFMSLSYYLNRLQKYGAIAAGKATQASGMGFSQVGFGLIPMGFSGLILGKVAGEFFGAFVLWFQKKKISEAEKYGISPGRLLFFAKKYRDFPVYNAPHSLFNNISSNIPIFLFVRYFGESLTGLYSMAVKATHMPVQIIANSFGQVFSRKISEYYREGQDIHDFFKKTVLSLALFAVIPFGLIAVFGPEIFTFILGPEWEMTGVIVRYITPWIYLAFIVGPLAFIPMMLNRQRKAMIIEIIYMLLRLAGILFGIYSSDFILAVQLFTATGVIVMLYQIWWINGLCKNHQTQLGRTAKVEG